MSKTINPNNPIQTYELSISCKGLKDADIFSKSDPMVVMYVKSLSNEWREIGRTEHIMNTLNPEFVKKFFIDDFPSETQYLKFKVYDIDKDSPELKDHDFIGWAECELHSVLTAPRQKLTLDLDLIDEDDITKNDKSKRRNRKIKGSITIKAEKMSTTRKWIYMKWEAKQLVKPSRLTSINPFMVFSRIYKEDDSFTVSHKTEVIKNDLNPEWKIIEISAGELCGENLDRKLKIEIYDYNRNGSHSLIGDFTASLQEFEKSKTRTYKCSLPNSKSEVKKTTGTLMLAVFDITERKSFEDHIRGSTTLSPIIAIDFSKPGKKKLDQKAYEVAIETVCNVIQEKRKDGDLFKAFGFAAHYSNDTEEPIPLNLLRQSPECIGCDEVIEAYKECMKTFQGADSKSISPIIQHVTKMASRKSSNMDEYFILIVLVNAGKLSDLEKTKESIVKASRLPMSIVFVGIGDDNFQEVEQLQGHIVKLTYVKGKEKHEAKRDIVHFVRFRDFTSNNKCQILSMPRLAKEILRKIPDQFMEYVSKIETEKLLSTKVFKK